MFFLKIFDSAQTPGGIRLGTPAMTTRGMLEDDMVKIAGYLLKSIEISKRVQDKAGKKLVDFLPALEADEELHQVAAEVKAWAQKFSIPGV